MWRWTEAKRTAAELIACGRSHRAIARATGANRRSIARWVRRNEFRAEVERHRLRRAIREGLFRDVADAERHREEAACVVFGTAIDAEPTQATAKEFVEATRRYRAAADRERRLERTVAGDPIR